MPEATVNENHSAIFGQNNVWRAREVGPMEPEPKTHRVQRLSDGNFGLRIRSPDCSHDLRSDDCANVIHAAIIATDR
jgi:hypothetical protein